MSDLNFKWFHGISSLAMSSWPMWLLMSWHSYSLSACFYQIYGVLKNIANISGVTALARYRSGALFLEGCDLYGVVNPIDYPCYSFQTSNLKIVAVSFFCYAAFPWIFFLKFNSTLTAIHEDLNHQNHHVLHIFWKLRPCSFTWPYPG